MYMYTFKDGKIYSENTFMYSAIHIPMAPSIAYDCVVVMEGLIHVGL